MVFLQRPIIKRLKRTPWYQLRFARKKFSESGFETKKTAFWIFLNFGFQVKKFEGYLLPLIVVNPCQGVQYTFLIASNALHCLMEGFGSLLCIEVWLGPYCAVELMLITEHLQVNLAVEYALSSIFHKPFDTDKQSEDNKNIKNKVKTIKTSEK